MDKTIARLPKLMRRLDRIVKELEELFPGRHFTLDGHIVGSLGEAWAVSMYDLRLLRASAPGHDAEARDGRRVQIKATQCNSVPLTSQPDHLIVLRLNCGPEPEIVYDGPGRKPWNECGKQGKNGQRRITLNKLRRLMKPIPKEARLQRR